MQGHKKKFRKSLRLGMAYNGVLGTEAPIALTTTTTFTTTTASSIDSGDSSKSNYIFCCSSCNVGCIKRIPWNFSKFSGVLSQ